MEKRFGGSINLVNPGPISLHEILQLYKKFVDPKLPEYEVVGENSEKGRQLLATKGNCALDTTKLLQHCPFIPTTAESLMNGFKRIISNNNK
uniref:Anthocyanidin reductase n=1 Tax=Panagrolaimus superbus TaxID=310955 RepID=A0A914YQA8_9BILA